MRIGLVTNMMDQQSAGIGRYTENLTKELLLNNKENTYYLIHSNKKKYDFKGNYQEIRLPFFDSIPKKLLIGGPVIEKICVDHKLDILHDFGQISPFFLKSKTKKILTIFDLGPILFPQFFTTLTCTYSKLFPVILNNTDHIITISENSKKDIVNTFKIPKEKITVTHLGVEDRFRPVKNKEYLKKIRKKYKLPEKFILFVGTIEPRKNLPLLLSAFSKIKDRFDTNLVIAGKLGWKYESIYKTFDELGITRNVILTGFVDDNHLPVLYNLADVLVYPSLYEGFGLPVLEALSCGCPVITSKFSVLRQDLKKCCFLIDPGDEASLCRALEMPYMNVKRVKVFADKGLKAAHEYSWTKCSYNTLNVYNALHE